MDEPADVGEGSHLPQLGGALARGAAMAGEDLAQLQGEGGEPVVAVSKAGVRFTHRHRLGGVAANRREIKKNGLHLVADRSHAHLRRKSREGYITSRRKPWSAPPHRATRSGPRAPSHRSLPRKSSSCPARPWRDRRAN